MAGPDRDLTFKITAEGDADVTKLANAIRKLEKQLDDLQKIRKAKLDVDIGLVEAKIKKIKTTLDNLRSKQSTPKIDADIKLAEANLKKLEHQLSSLQDRKRIQVQVDVDMDSIKDIDIDENSLAKVAQRTGQSFMDQVRTKIHRNRPSVAAVLAATILAGGPLITAAAGAAFIGIAVAAQAMAASVQAAWRGVGMEIINNLRQDTAQLAPAIVGMIRTIGDAFTEIRPLMIETFAAMGPQIQALGDGIHGLITRMMPGLAQLAQSALPAFQGLAQMLTNIGEGLSKFFANISTASGSMGSIFGNLGSHIEALLSVIGRLLAVGTEFFAGVLSTYVPVMNTFLGIVESLLSAIQPFAGALGSLTGLVLAGAAAWKLMNLAMVPVVALGSRLSTVTTASTGMTNAFTKAGQAVQRLGSALPVVGMAAVAVGFAMEQLSPKTDEWSASVLRGDMTMKELDKTVKIHNASVAAASATTVGFAGSNALAAGQTALFSTNLQAQTQAFQQQLSAMSPLEQAQARLNMAQAEWGEHVKNGTQNTAAGQQALQDLTVAKNNLETATKAASDAEKDHADRIMETTNNISNALGTYVSFEQAVLKLEDAAKKANQANKDGAAATREGKEANLEAVQAANQMAVAAQKNVEAQATLRGETDAGAQGTAAYNLSLLSAAATLSGPARSAILSHVTALDSSTLAAITATAEANSFKDTILTLPDGRTVKVDAEVLQALSSVDGLTKYINAQKGQVGVTAPIDAAKAGVAAWRAAEEANDTVIPTTANTAPATVNAGAWRAAEEANDAVIPTDANTQPAIINAGNWRAAEEANDVVIPTDANTQPAIINAGAWRAAEEANDVVIPTDAATEPAASTIQNFRAAEEANDIVLTVTVQFSSGTGFGARPPPGFAEGGIVPVGVRYYATGGVEDMQPMAAGVARVVPPNSMRVIGDNPTVNESYIPWKRTPWTLHLLQRTANALGERLESQSALGMDSGGLIGMLNPSSSPVGPAPTSVAVLEKQMARVVETIERYGTGPQIVVNDRSGDPVQMARETQQLLRLG